jgi:lipase chaperone LimK
MAIRRPILWIGAAALAAAICIPMLMRHAQQKPSQAAAAAPDYFPFVRSLEGTRPDDDIQVGDDDGLVVDARLVRMFDYYLSAIGEKPLDTVHQEIEKDLDRRLKPAAAAEAKRLLMQYIGYKTALVDLDKNPQLAGTGVSAIRHRMEKVQQVRARYFSAAEDKGMFGASDAYDTDTAARMEISQDKSLSAAQKSAKLAALDAAMPADLLEARTAPLKIVKLEASAASMRKQGAGEDDIYRMRAAALSPEAAARMADVDRDEAAWKSRISAYLAVRSNLDNQEAVAALRNKMFDANEQKRLTAYEK